LQVPEPEMVAVNDDVVMEAAVSDEDTEMAVAAIANDTTAPSSDVTMNTVDALDNNNVVQNNAGKN